MKPNILINCKWQTHERTTGVQRYATDLTNALSDAGLVFDQAKPKPGPIWKSTLWEQRVLPKLAREYDTLLCPANMAPCALDKDVRLILTIHCLRFYFHPENYTRSFVNWYRFMIPKIIARADSILTVSQTTALEIQRIYPESTGKVKVVYPGVSSLFTDEGSSSDVSTPLEPYWVFIGNAAPAKNLKVVLEALQISDRPHRLVLLGVDERQLKSVDIQFPVDRVFPIGHINDTARVASILRGADGLLAPSIYESFDLPTIEAMACGCSVLASDTLVHREIGQGVPMYITPTNSAQWAFVMDQFLQKPDEVHQRRIEGLERASQFRWSKAAMHVMSIINRHSPEPMTP